MRKVVDQFCYPARFMAVLAVGLIVFDSFVLGATATKSLWSVIWCLIALGINLIIVVSYVMGFTDEHDRGTQ